MKRPDWSPPHTRLVWIKLRRLRAALADETSIGQAPVGDALGVLHDEHIVVCDGDNWRGLHELRSATISELLHNGPPPRLGTRSQEWPD